MKRILSLVLVIAMMVTMLVLSGCDEHEHSYGEWTIEKAATCTETGTKSRACECGEKETEEIPALGHNFVDGVCTECGATE